MNTQTINVIACPACKGQLRNSDVGLECQGCSRTYPVVDGVPYLCPPSDELTVDPGKLRIKSQSEAARTVADMKRIDWGFISRPRLFYLAYVLLLVFAIVGLWEGFLVVVAVLFVDWLFFRWRRRRILAGYERNPVRLRTMADFQAVDDVYTREGKSQPTMADWSRVASQACGIASEADGPGAGERERYLDILAVYEQRQSARDVVVDVGTADGVSHVEFKIGQGATFIGIDISSQLLQQFRRNAPGQLALQADGLCLPLKDDSVDFLFSTETLEHIADPHEAIREFTRVLKPGGRMMVQSPNAHRIRNLNPFHILTLVVSLVDDRVLQKKSIHENTWHNGITYHWDFSIQDYRRMVGKARIVELRSQAFFFPDFLLRHKSDRIRRKERLLARVPLLRFMGDDLVLVAEKERHQDS